MTQNIIEGFARAGALLTLILACLTPAGAQAFAGVLTQHNDVGRTGQNLSETILTPQNVSAATFGKLFSYSVDGQIYAQPLYVPNVSIPGQGTHNVVYVETQNDSVYAFDADGLSPTALWQVSYVDPAAGITPVSCMTDGKSDISCGVYPIYGITSTPVIDPSTTPPTMYLLSRTDNKGTYYQTLHAIDITTGLDISGSPVNISGSVPGTGDGSDKGIVNFLSLQDLQRAGLLELNGIIYIGWAGAKHGWIMGYNAAGYDAPTLQQTAIFNTTPNSRIGGVWAAGNGLAADSSGNIYAAVGNALFDANTGGSDYGDSVLKLGADLSVVDYFTPNDQSCRAANDLDLGSGGPMILPTQSGSVPNEFLMLGKGGAPCDSDPVASRMYLLNQEDLGEYNTTQDLAVEEVVGSGIGYLSSPAYWQGASAANVYAAGATAYGGGGDYLKMYSVTDGLLSATPTAQSTNLFPVGATPSISANGTEDGIVWAVERTQTWDSIQPGPGPAAVLYAYDATDLTMLYSSNSALHNGVARDRGGCGNKFAVPTIANGMVYVGTQNELDVYGFLGSGKTPNVYLEYPCYTFKASTLGKHVQETIGLKNSGTATLTISNIAISGSNAADFSQTNTCTSLPPMTKECIITVGFTASMLGPETAYVTITDNAVGSPHNIYLTGVGEN
jgi:hypothetical protein